MIVNTKEKIPALRFPEFEGEWEEKRLGEVATFFSGGTPLTTKTGYYFGDIPFIKSGEINADRTEQFISEDGLKNSTAKRVKKGDLLYALYGATSGEVGISKIDGAINQAVLCIRSSQLTYFIFLFLQFNKTKIVNTYLQGGQGNLSAHIIKSIKINLPSLPEQQKIAAFLTAVDTRIQQLTRKKTLLEQYKKGVMQQIFAREIRFRDDQGRAFPDWKEKRLGEVFSEITKKNDGKGHTVMTISSRIGLVSQKEKFDRIIAGDSLKKYTLLNKGDFAYNKGNSKSYEMGCIYPLEQEKTALVPFVYICFSPSELAYYLFYKHWFLNHGLDRQLKKIITSGVRGDGLLNVRSEEFFRLLVAFPNKDEQQKIAAFLSAIDVKIDQVGKQLRGMQEFKKGLLQQMFV